jgi:tetrapyrrole methylase family protein/MazG family protein
VITCDDLYDTLEDFDAVYNGIVDRVLGFASTENVVYAVPGSALVGERAVTLLQAAAAEQGIDMQILASQSFLDLAYVAVGLDPIADGLQVVDARSLPDPLPFHLPTIITQVDSRLRAGDVSVALGRTLEPDHPIVILDRLGDTDAIVEKSTVRQLATFDAGERTSVFVGRSTSGLLGLIETNRILRSECPWDRKQTHHSLVTHLIEEAYETVDAIGALPPEAPAGESDFGAYAEVEEELGDLLLQVVFHATLASETGAFDIDEVAEAIRRKLVARHPHVFGDVAVSGADEVLANWEKLKQDEKQRASLMDDIPHSMPGVGRAMKVQKRASSVGFDWDEPTAVFQVLEAEIAELAAATDADERTHELGDVLFSAINLARHLDVDPEVALRRSVDRFSERFRAVEVDLAAQGLDIAQATDQQLDKAWTRAKLNHLDNQEPKQ